MPDLGARLVGLVLEHPDPDAIAGRYRALGLAGAPALRRGPTLRYRAEIATPDGLRTLA